MLRSHTLTRTLTCACEPLIACGHCFVDTRSLRTTSPLRVFASQGKAGGGGGAGSGRGTGSSSEVSTGANRAAVVSSDGRVGSGRAGDSSEGSGGVLFLARNARREGGDPVAVGVAGRSRGLVSPVPAHEVPAPSGHRRRASIASTCSSIDSLTDGPGLGGGRANRPPRVSSAEAQGRPKAGTHRVSRRGVVDGGEG